MRAFLFQTLGLVTLLALAGNSQADPSIKVIDERGCLLGLTTGGQTRTQPTLDFVGAHYDEPGIRREVLLQMTQTALAAGCPADEPVDTGGLTPLNVAILFNRPDLVALLLRYGADPERRIRRPGRASDGWNSYQLQAFLKQKRPLDRSAIDRLLEEHRHSSARP